MLHIWWAWIAAALVFGILEVLAPSFIFLGFALSALALGLWIWVIGTTLSPALLIAIFALLALVAWLGLRALFKLPKGQVKTFDHDIND